MGGEIDALIARAREGSQYWASEQEDGHLCLSINSVDAVLTELADALESLRPRTITTVEELDALPDGSCVRVEYRLNGATIILDDKAVTHASRPYLREDIGLGHESATGVLATFTVLYTPTEGDKT